MFGEITINYAEATAMVLFSIGLMMMLLSRNIIKKIIGFNITDTALDLFLASMGYIEGGTVPIVSGTEEVLYINPIPSSLVLTSIVVSVSVTALMLALSVRLYKVYHTLDLDEIYMAMREEDEK